jgi:uracil-DNA glycosylase family 4
MLKQGLLIKTEASQSGRCHDCQLYHNVQSPCIEPFGNGRKGIMIVGEAPGEIEDQVGKPWQGKAGSLLAQTLREMGIGLFEDCVNVNAVNCRPTTKSGSNRSPTAKEINACRPKVLSAIERYHPRAIILMGACAVESVIGANWKKDIGTIEKWAGRAIPDQVLRTFICPTYHPSFVLRSGKAPEVSRQWKKHLREVLRRVRVRESFPIFDNLADYVEIAEDLSWIRDIPSGSTIAIDYETTGLKPWADGHRIVAVGIAVE